MLRLWNLYPLLLLTWPVLPYRLGKSQGDVHNVPEGDSHTSVKPSQGPSQPSLTPTVPLFVATDVGLSFMDDTQGVIGEYPDEQDSSETSLLHPSTDVLTLFEPTDTVSDVQEVRATSGITESSSGFPSQSIREQTHQSEAADSRVSHSRGPTSPSRAEDRRDKSADSQVPFLLSASPPPQSLDPWTVSQLSTGQPTPTLHSNSRTEGLTEETTPLKDTGHSVNDCGGDEDGLTEGNRQGSKVGGQPGLDGNFDPSAAPCETNQSWAQGPDGSIPDESLLPPVGVNLPLFVPLHADWSSALATWGFAWQAHVYGLGSVFIVFGLISAMCLLGLPFCCPPGALYFSLLHLVVLAFAGMQAFFLLYDAYNHKDRLPPVCSLLLSELALPCLISAFSLAFHLLSLRSRMRLSLPLAISTSFSVLPRPSLLLCLCLLHFGLSLGCVGLLQLTHRLPVIIALLPQGLFVCLSAFLSLAYLTFFCFIRVDTKHIYRLRDCGENGGSPEVMPPARCPFVKVEDWGRAAGAGIGASVFLLGCGGLQLYGVLHALGLGGVDGFGFRPWPWWSYQVCCRLCELGLCLCLSLIAAYPIFCQGSSIGTVTCPWPGSWSRLSSCSPSRGVSLPSQDSMNSPVLSSHYSWSQSKQEKIVICEVISKGPVQDLPLSSMRDPPSKELEIVANSKKTLVPALPLPSPPSPPHRPKQEVEPQSSPQDNIGLDSDSTGDLRPPSPINLSRSIDQALFSESLFSHSLFGLPGLPHTSSSHSLSSSSQVASNQRPNSVENALYRTSSCGDVEQDSTLSGSRACKPHGSLSCQAAQSASPEQWNLEGSYCGSLCRASLSSSSQGLCCTKREPGKTRSHHWSHKAQHFAPSSLPRAIPHLPYHRRYRTLSAASQDKHEQDRLAGTKHLSESKQLEWDTAVQAEFVSVCRQIDALSVCSDTIEL